MIIKNMIRRFLVKEGSGNFVDKEDNIRPKTVR